MTRDILVRDGLRNRSRHDGRRWRIDARFTTTVSMCPSRQRVGHASRNRSIAPWKAADGRLCPRCLTVWVSRAFSTRLTFGARSRHVNSSREIMATVQRFYIMKFQPIVRITQQSVVKFDSLFLSRNKNISLYRHSRVYNHRVIYGPG